jgi:gliding motility-associated-like protein/uncharacterized repeat protein (TIGR01451 family)
MTTTSSLFIRGFFKMGTSALRCCFFALLWIFQLGLVSVLGMLPSMATTVETKDARILVLVVDPGTIDGNQIVCAGTAPLPLSNVISPSPSNVLLTFHWEQSSSSSSTGYTIIPASPALSFSPGVLTQTTWFRRATTYLGDTFYTVPVKITVTSNTANNIGSDQQICPNSVPAILSGSSLDTFISYQWLSSTTSGTTDFLPASGVSTTQQYAPSSLTQTTWYKRVVYNGPCIPDTTAAIIITVSPPAIGGTLRGGNRYCTGINSTTLTLSGYVGNISNWQWSSSRNFSTGINNIENTVNTYYITNVTFTKYYRAVIVNPGCPNNPATYSSVDSIVVNTPAVGGIVTGGSTVCIGMNTTLFLTGYSGNIRRWESSPSSSFSSSVVKIANTSDTLVTSNLFVTTYFRAVIQKDSCLAVVSSVDSVLIVKTIGGTVSRTGGICPVCANTNAETLTLKGYTGTILNWQSSPQFNFSINVTNIANTSDTITAANLIATTYYRAVVQYGNCPISKSSASLINVSSLVKPGKVSGGAKYCVGPNNTTLTLSGIVGGVVRWESCLNPDFSTGVTNISTSKSSLNISDLGVTTYYRALVANGNICPSAYSTIDSIVIYPIAVGGTVLGNHDTVCVGTNTTVFTLKDNTGAIQWQTSTTSATSGFGNISGAADSIYIANNLSAKKYFRAIVTSGICPSSISSVDSIIISPTSIGGIVSSNNHIVCEGINSTTLTLSGHTGSIQWQASQSTATSGFSDIIGATNTTYIATNLDTKTYFRAIITSGTCSAVSSNVDSVLINPRSFGGSVSSNHYTVCSGTNTTIITLSNYLGTIQWQASTSSSSSGFTNINSATASTYIANNLSLKTYFRAIVTNGICEPSISTVDSILVNQISVGGSISSNHANVCVGTNASSFSLLGSNGAAQWQSSTTSSTSGFIDISGANGPTYIANNLSVKTYFRAIVTNGVCQPTTSTVDSVIANPLSVGGIVLSNNQVVCAGTNTTTLNLSGYTGNIQWQAALNSDSSAFSSISGATSSTYIATNLTRKTYFRAIITSGVCPSILSSLDSVLTNTISVGGIVSGSQDTACIGTNSTIFSLSGYTGNIQWQASTNSAVSGFSDIIGAAAPLHFANNLYEKTYFRAILTNGVCPSTTSTIDSLIINPTSVGGTVSGNNDTVCIGTNSTTFNLSGNTGNIQWQTSTTSASTDFTNIIGATGSTYIANNLSVKTYFRAIVTSGICAPSISNVDSVLINILSVAGTVLGNLDSVCAGTNSTVLTLSAHTGSIQWQSSTSAANIGFSNIIGATSPNYVANNLSVKTYFRTVVSNGVCPGSISNADSILISPTSGGGIILSNNDSVCIGTNTTLLTLSGYTGNIQWQESTSSATSGFSNIKGANTLTYNAENLSVTTYFRTIVTSGVCSPSTSNVHPVIVNFASVGGTISGNYDTVCFGNNTTTFTISGYAGNVQWQSSTSSAVADFSDLIGAATPIYSANNLSIKTYFRAILSSGVCPVSISDVDSVLVNTPILTNFISGNVRSCFGYSGGLLLGSTPTGGNNDTYSYLWLYSTIGSDTGFKTCEGIYNTKDYSPGTRTQHTWYKRIVTSTPCSIDTSNSIMDTVNLKIAYSFPSKPISVTYGTAPLLPSTILVKYIDSTSEMRPITWDTTGYNQNIGTYNYIGFIDLAAGTCNSDGYNGFISITITPQKIVVKADRKVKAFETSDPQLTFKIISGSLIGTDTFSGSLSREPGETTGRYSILQNNLSLSGNYTLTYIGDSLIITTNVINLSVSQTSSKTFMYAGDSVTYTIQVQNNGPDSLQAGQEITFINQPEQGLNLVAYQTANGTYNASTGELTLFNSFIPGQLVELQIQATVDLNYQGDSIGDFISIVLPTDKFNLEDSTASIFISTSRIIDLSIQKFVDKTITQPLDTLNYSLVVKHNGRSALFKNETFFIHEFLPDSLSQIEFKALSPLGSSYDQTNGAYTLGETFLPGDSLILNVRGIIPKMFDQSSITNCVTVKAPHGVLDVNTSNDSSWITIPLKQYATPLEIVVSDQTVCKGNLVNVKVSSTGILNPIYTWYADSLLTKPICHLTLLDTLLFSTTSFFITVKGYNRLENMPGSAKKITINVHDYASDTTTVTNDTLICYGTQTSLVCKAKRPITNPEYTWYALPELTVPIAKGNTFKTGTLTKDTLFYIAINGSNACEGRELQIVRITINKDCGQVNLGLAKSLSKTTQRDNGSFDLVFNFVAVNFSDEPIIDVRLIDDLKPVFPNALITVVGSSTTGNWNLNDKYDGLNNIELLDTGSRLEIGDRQTLQLTINLAFQPNDTSTLFKNIAEIRGLSQVNGKSIVRKSKDGQEPTLDSLTVDSSAQPTPIVLPIRYKPNPKPKDIGTLFIPEGFSPNGDNANDLFIIENPDNYILSIVIFNRWGTIMYENSNYDNSWDGTAKKGVKHGEGVPDGTYFYTLEYTDTEGSTHKLAHSLTIIR